MLPSHAAKTRRSFPAARNNFLTENTQPKQDPYTRRRYHHDGIAFQDVYIELQHVLARARSTSDNRFSVVHHPIAPRALAALLHYHHNEDEYSYVLKGSLGALLGDDVIFAEPGFKIPRCADGSKSASTKEKHATPLRRLHKVCVMLSSSTLVFGDLFSENISKREEQSSMATFDRLLVSSSDRNRVFTPELLTSPVKIQSVR